MPAPIVARLHLVFTQWEAELQKSSSIDATCSMLQREPEMPQSAAVVRVQVLCEDTALGWRLNLVSCVHVEKCARELLAAGMVLLPGTAPDHSSAISNPSVAYDETFVVCTVGGKASRNSASDASLMNTIDRCMQPLRSALLSLGSSPVEGAASPALVEGDQQPSRFVIAIL